MIGIDLGTTNSLVSVMENGNPRVLENEIGESLTPSVVAVAEDGQLLVGRAARDRMILSPESGQAHFKRDMGTERRYDFGGKLWTPVECSAVVLKEMKRIAENHLGGTVDSAVITVPAYFHDQQRHATIEAARIAGLTVERIINEPTAAALAYGYRNPEEETTLLVFDLGGGTFDVTVLEVFDGVIEIKASSGDSHLGGEDYTDAVLNHLIGKIQSGGEGEARVHSDRLQWRQNVETAKRKLTNQESVKIGIGENEFELTREDFANITKEISMRLKPVVSRCLRDAGISAGELDDVLLVGGASRMAEVHEFVAAHLERIPSQKLDADRVVALGAAIQAALCADDEAVGDLVLTDVCPHTLGVEIAKELLPGQIVEGFFSPIIDRNTTVPTSRSNLFNTLHPQQDELRLCVFQGESRKVIDNQKIGEIKVSGLKHRPGQEHPGVVEVRFSYDMNGILEVEVTVLHNKKKYSKVIEQRPGTLSPSAIKEAIARLAPLKLKPRDLLPNRARIERANRVYKELVGTARDHFEIIVSNFESALDSQDVEQIKISGSVLDSFMRPFYELEGEDQPRNS